LSTCHALLQALMNPGAMAILTGKNPQIIPMPRSSSGR